ncbi:MAG: hypothetical protein U5R49_09280 [Deltaproteobacteria bacterium]|nr:hypothetical protein [Deltaproteobacteria bacterium]
MRCNQCGGHYLTKHDNLEQTDEYLGHFTVKAVEYLQCDRCGDLAYPPKTIKEIEKTRHAALEEKLQSLPLRDFVSSTKAAAMLGISRQALHKHRRIRRGFIFQAQFDDRKAYLKASVKRFEETGDGRFPLVEPERESKYSRNQDMAFIILTYNNSSFCGLPQSSTWDQTLRIGSISYARK